MYPDAEAGLVGGEEHINPHVKQKLRDVSEELKPDVLELVMHVTHEAVLGRMETRLASGAVMEVLILSNKVKENG